MGKYGFGYIRVCNTDTALFAGALGYACTDDSMHVGHYFTRKERDRATSVDQVAPQRF